MWANFWEPGSEFTAKGQPAEFLKKGPGVRIEVAWAVDAWENPLGQKWKATNSREKGLGYA